MLAPTQLRKEVVILADYKFSYLLKKYFETLRKAKLEEDRLVQAEQSRKTAKIPEGRHLSRSSKQYRAVTKSRDQKFQRLDSSIKRAKDKCTEARKEVENARSRFDQYAAEYAGAPEGYRYEVMISGNIIDVFYGKDNPYEENHCHAVYNQVGDCSHYRPLGTPHVSHWSELPARPGRVLANS